MTKAYPHRRSRPAWTLLQTAIPRGKARSVAAGCFVWLAALSGCSADPVCKGPAGLCLEAAASEAVGGNVATPTRTGGVASEGGTSMGVAAAAGKGGLGGVSGVASLDEGRGVGEGFGGGAPDSPADAGAPGAGGAFCDGETSYEAALPMAIEEWFEPTAYAGDSATELVPLNGCAYPHDAVCYAFEWTPRQLDRVSVSWEPRSSTPTVQDGLCVQARAQQVYFTASSDPPGEVVTFGIAGTPLTTETLNYWPQTYYPDVQGLDYNHLQSSSGVESAFYFEWQAGPEPAATRHLYISGVSWTAPRAPPERCEPPGSLTLDCNTPVGGAPGGDPSGPTPGVCDEPTSPIDDTAIGPSFLLVDDFEDGNEWANPLPNGQAFWSTFEHQLEEGDYQYPEPCVRPTPMDLIGGSTGVPPAGNAWAFLTYGCGFGPAGNGVRLVTRTGDLDCNRPFDASGYDGIQFRARASLPMLLQVATAATTLIGEGGLCDGSEGPGGPAGPPPLRASKALALWPPDDGSSPGGPYGSCLAPFASDVLYAYDWKLFRIPFAALRQYSQVEFDPQTIMSFSWETSSSGAGPMEPGGKFTFAIDDVALYRQ